MRQRWPAALAAASLAAAALTAAPAPAMAPAGLTGLVSEMPAAGTPHVMDGAVLDLARIGDRVVVVGTFRTVSPAGTFHAPRDDLRRRGIFAFDLRTGAVDRRFHPRLDGPAYTIDTDGSYLYVGGDFATVDGRPARHLVKLTRHGAEVRRFVAAPDAAVTDLAVHGTRVYVAGGFRAVRSHRHTTRQGALAAVHARTGRVLRAVRLGFAGVYDSSRPTPGRTDVRRLDLSADGRRLVAVGNFRTVAGRLRPQVVVLDTDGPRARVTRWQTRRFGVDRSRCGPLMNSFVRDVALSPDGRWFAVTASGGYAGGGRAGTLCDTVSAWSARGAGRARWVAYTGGDTSLGVAVTRDAVYVGGHMRWFNNPYGNGHRGPGGVHRRGIAALDPRNGLPLSWNPGRRRGVGAQALLAAREGLWIGSDTTLIAAQRRGRIALMPSAGGRPVAPVGRAVLPNDLYVVHSSRLERRTLGTFGRPHGGPTVVDTTADWSDVRGAFLVDHTLFLGRRNGTLQRRRFDPDTGALGRARPVDLHDAADGTRIRFPLGRLTGMFLAPATHQLYYTVRGDPHLYRRAFTPESRVVGAMARTARTCGLDLSHVAGMTLAGGRVLYGSRDGSLRSVRFDRGGLRGTPRLLSRDGAWRAHAFFVPNR